MSCGWLIGRSNSSGTRATIKKCDRDSASKKNLHSIGDTIMLGPVGLSVVAVVSLAAFMVATYARMFR
jgi:hypothetical protein